VQGQSLRPSLRLLARNGVDPPEYPPVPSAHLAVQEAVEDRDKEALEGDKQQSHRGGAANRHPQAQGLGALGMSVFGRGQKQCEASARMVSSTSLGEGTRMEASAEDHTWKDSKKELK